ncbi:hypothetical protein NW754_004193 [Fusarium falciforme]|uniref:FAD dependent oxidoreductase domain-containing protein n=1 Tax=Fusarium falciforme TaxID=195108 RepID=A0A9W8RBP1_9HYPO|nr:hypothetical protein NW754_004193 [Fusarium falciforme]KAJ4190436.1 hypothetical protein NW755_005578 [Fusarium falciforme]
MDNARATRWLQTPMGRTIVAQIEADPGLPQSSSTISSWQVPFHPDVGRIQSEALPQFSDYIIIGSGVAGCGVVKSLLENSSPAQSSVTVLEARGLCSGATGRNGGQLVKPYPSRFVQLAQDFGIEVAVKVFRLANHTLEEMHKLADSYDDQLREDAAARRVTKMVAFMDQRSWIQGQKDAKFYEEHMPEERGLFKFLTKEQMKKEWNVKGAYGGLSFPSGVCWPYRLITGVFKRLQDQFPDRLNIETNTPVTTILYDDKTDAKYPYIITTPRGIVKAAHVIHCTNGHTGHLLPRLRGKIFPMREAMSAQHVGDKMPDMSDQMSWTFLEEPKFDSKTGMIRIGWVYGLQNRNNGGFWIGGEDRRPEEMIASDDSVISIQGKVDLETKLTQVFSHNWVPKQPRIQGIWTGIMASTGDTLPFVGNLPASVTGRPGKGEWIAGGWNQYGMTNGLTCGEALGRMVLGLKVPEIIPREYLITEERLGNKKFATEASALDYLQWTTVGATIEKEDASGVSRL